MKHLIKILIALLSLTIVVGVTSCDKDDDPATQPVPHPNPGPNPDPVPPVAGNQVKITVGSTMFTATLQENETTNAFKQLLPMTINMSELNNNEKFYDLPGTLPAHPANPATIQNGDLMLYGSRTLVLFYKTFSTSYSYTRIGRIDNPLGLEAALGAGSVSVSFEMAK